MDGKEFVSAVVVVFLSLWASLYMETALESYFVAELFVIFALVIVASGIMYAVASGKIWGWNALAFFFGISFLNSAAVYALTGELILFSVAAVVNLGGIIMSLSSRAYAEDSEIYSPDHIFKIAESDLVDHLETYEIKKRDMNAPAKSKKKKAVKKKKKK